MMDSTHQLVANAEPSPEVTPPAAGGTWPQEATGDSESSDVAASVQAAGCSSEDDNDDDDAGSCSGGGKGGHDDIDSFFKGDGSDEDDVATEIDETEVDSKMSAPWWRWTHEHAANDDGGGGCAPAIAAEGGKLSCHAAESNRLFWEACIAHGY